MARVLKRNGHAAVFDFDYSAFFIASNRGPLTRNTNRN